MTTRSDLVVVFDLDDTLYKEFDYNQSGILAVAAEIKTLYGKDLSVQLCRAAEQREDVWLLACELLDLPASVKESFLWIYRLHAPAIRLAEAVSALIPGLQSQAKAVVILTDGRSVSQRKKLQALGLGRIDVFVSEEWGSAKPDDLRFREIMRRYPGCRYVYIGDNPAKDFYAPKLLAWSTVGVRADDRNIHSQQNTGQQFFTEPDQWIASVSELRGVLAN